MIQKIKIMIHEHERELDEIHKCLVKNANNINESWMKKRVIISLKKSL